MPVITYKLETVVDIDNGSISMKLDPDPSENPGDPVGFVMFLSSELAGKIFSVIDDQQKIKKVQEIFADLMAV